MTEHCARCGQPLGIGRFCLNCGHPVDAEAPIVEPLTHDDRESPLHRGRRGWLVWTLWAAVFAGLALAGAFGVGLLVADTGVQVNPVPTSTPSSSPRATPTTPSSTPSESPSSSPSSTQPTDVARLATARVPATAPPNQDLSGNMVRYEARHLLDGVATTCWRMPGDATNEEITIELAEPTTLTTVGLINGYAKSARDSSGRKLDWYHGNRRVLSVEWIFDDGTSVTQDFEDDRTLQELEIDPVTTSRVRLRLISVSTPGSGRSARDYTAISDVALVGTAG